MPAPQGSAGFSPCLSFRLSGVDALPLRCMSIRVGLSRLSEARKFISGVRARMVPVFFRIRHVLRHFTRT